MEITKLYSQDFWLWVDAHLDKNTNELRLKFGNKEPYSSAIAQIEARKKYRSKFIGLPKHWIYPTGIPLEQSSSAATAALKSNLFTTTFSADLCAGMGIDSHAILKRNGAKGHLCFEQNKALAELLEINLPQAQVIAEPFHLQALDQWIKDHGIESTDLTVYLDPDRRANHSRTYNISDGTPDLAGLQGDLIQRCKRVVAKHSPMLDIDSLMNQLDHITEIHIVQHQGECKELLSIQEKVHIGPALIQLTDTSNQIIRFQEDMLPEPMVTSELDNYLIQPSAGLNKSQLHQYLGLQLGWKKWLNTPLYTAKKPPVQSPFYKVFEISKTYQSIKKANISGPAAIECFGTKITVEQVRKQFKIKEGRNRKWFIVQNLSDKIIIDAALVE